MVKGLYLVFLLVLLLMPVVFSQEYVKTPITIKAEPNSRVWLVIRDQTTNRAIGSFNTTMNSGGEKVLNFDSTRRMLAFDASVYESGILTKSKNFSGFTAGDSAVLDMNAEEAVEEENNETEINATENATGNEGNATITGSAISEGGIDMKTIYYIIGGVFLALIIVFAAYTVTQKRKLPGSYTVTKLSDKLNKAEEPEKQEKVYSEDEELREAEKKLEGMQKELDKLKKIKEAERNFDEARKELDMLRGADSP